jgi:hypothetical protein
VWGYQHFYTQPGAGRQTATVSRCYQHDVKNKITQNPVILTTNTLLFTEKQWRGGEIGWV